MELHEILTEAKRRLATPEEVKTGDNRHNEYVCHIITQMYTEGLISGEEEQRAKKFVLDSLRVPRKPQCTAYASYLINVDPEMKKLYDTVHRHDFYVLVQERKHVWLEGLIEKAKK